MKPKKCCYPNCFECPYDDCRYNGIECGERKLQDIFDKELEVVETEILKRRQKQKRYSKTEKYKKSQDLYNMSDKRKESQKRYNQSQKGKDARKRYLDSEKGSEMQKRKQLKKIESGRNAENCRRYYWRKKLEREGMTCGKENC